MPITPDALLCPDHHPSPSLPSLYLACPQPLLLPFSRRKRQTCISVDHDGRTSVPITMDAPLCANCNGCASLWPHRHLVSTMACGIQVSKYLHHCDVHQCIHHHLMLTGTPQSAWRPPYGGTLLVSTSRDGGVFIPSFQADWDSPGRFGRPLWGKPEMKERLRGAPVRPPPLPSHVNWDSPERMATSLWRNPARFDE